MTFRYPFLNSRSKFSADAIQHVCVARAITEAKDNKETPKVSGNTSHLFGKGDIPNIHTSNFFLKVKCQPVISP